MPVINVEGDWLNQLLGRNYAVEELADALEQIGCDVDDVVDVDRFRCPKCAQIVESSPGAEVTNRCPWCEFEQEASFEKIGSGTVIRLDLLAARPDLFDVGGISRALKGYLGQTEGLPEYTVTPSDVVVTIDPQTSTDACPRPYIRCAIVEMPELNDVTLVSIMKLQEALHWGVGRDRKLASIGVYDLTTVQPPIHYTTIDPDKDRFEPLGRPGELMSGREILEKHPKGTAYAHLLEGHQRFPLLKDSNGVVLSMPPVINSEGTKVHLKSRRLFIDVTGISEAAVVKSLDTIVSSLVELGGQAFSVIMKFPDGKELVSPDLSPREMEIDLTAARRWLGLPLDNESLVNSLRRMRLDAVAVDADSGRFKVRYPALRTDFKHMVDVFEDLAIGFGYRNIEPQYASQSTTGQARPEEDASDPVRAVMLGLGATEIMSLPMTTEDLHYTKFRLPVPQHYPRIGNPKLKAMTVVRSHLMTGLMEHLRENKRAPLPIRFFELDNVTVLDAASETGAREERHLAVVEMGREASYASMRSIIDALLFELGLQGTYTAVEHASFIPGRVAQVTTDGEVSGIVGELHPEVILNFGLDHPVAIADFKIKNVY